MKKDNKILPILLGIGIVIFGIFILNRPMATLLAIISYMAAAVLIKGAFILYGCYKSYKDVQYFSKIELVYGVALVVLGIIFLSNPKFTSTLVFYIVAFWFIFDGIVGMFFATRRKTAIKWVGIILGALLVFFGLSIAVEPLRALFALNLLIGLAIVTNGIQLIVFQFIER